MRVLCVTTKADKKAGGGELYTSSILKLLELEAERVLVDFVCGVKRDSPARKAVRKGSAILRSAFQGGSAKSYYYRSFVSERELRRRVNSTPYDLYIINHGEMLWALDYVPSPASRMYIAHNRESALYKRYLERTAIPGIMKRFFLHDAERYERYESAYIPLARHIVAISDVEAEGYRREIPGVDVIVVPPVFFDEPHSYRPRKRGGLRLGFLANLTWWPNSSGLKWFLSEVASRVCTPFELHLFGKGSEAFKGKAAFLRAHGYVGDLAEVWNGCDLMINPIFEGGGVNVKVAEAIYNSMPLLCSPYALRGFSTPRAEPPFLFVHNTPEGWARVIESVAKGEVRLAAQPEENRALFSGDAYRDAFGDFLGRVLSQT